MTQWETPQREHALEKVTVSFTFTESIPSKPWADIVEKATSVMTGLEFSVINNAVGAPFSMGGPGRQFIQIAIGPGGTPFPGLQQSGTILNRNDGGVMLEQVSLLANSCSYTTTKYKSWTEFKARVLELLGAVLNGVYGLTSIQSIKLEYLDRFTYYKAGPVDYSTLFSKSSKFVPNFCHGVDGLWHSHIGYFAPKLEWRRLINANIDVIDFVKPSDNTEGPEPVHRSVSIYTMIDDAVGERVRDVGGVASDLEDLHTELKDMLRDMLSDAVAKQISLSEKVS